MVNWKINAENEEKKKLVEDIITNLPVSIFPESLTLIAKHKHTKIGPRPQDSVDHIEISPLEGKIEEIDRGSTAGCSNYKTNNSAVSFDFHQMYVDIYYEPQKGKR